MKDARSNASSGRRFPRRREVMLLCLSALIFLYSAVAPGAPAKTNDIAGRLPDLEGAVHGFPALLDLQGRKQADGEFTQWLEAGLLHVAITYDFGGGHRVEERAVFQQEPALVQENWSWSEFQDGALARHFEVDFKAGKATAEKRKNNELKHWSKNIKVEPGRTFAGFGFALAIKTLRARLVEGQTIELQAVGFSPKPRLVAVEISYGGLDQMAMGGRTVQGDRFVVHPKISWFLRLFIKLKDSRLWFTATRPTAFLRSENPLSEPYDPMVRVDVLPGERSGPAEPAGRN
jgi:hypothetical protein